MSKKILLPIPWPTPRQLQQRAGIKTPVKSVTIDVDDYNRAREAFIVLRDIEECIAADDHIIAGGGLHEEIRSVLS